MCVCERKRERERDCSDGVTSLLNLNRSTRIGKKSQPMKSFVMRFGGDGRPKMFAMDISFCVGRKTSYKWKIRILIFLACF